MPKSIFAALIAVCFASCTTDISRRAPFNASVGRPLVTKRATFLQRDPKGSPPEWHKIPNLEDEAKVRSPRDVRRLHQEASVPAGQQIRIHQVLNDVGDGAVFYYAMGQVFVPSLGRFVEFRYCWGYDDTVFRAAWEGTEVPEVRRVSW
jgi:hypothetical protein